ncbi:MAP7 domain-containing protein 1 [Lolium rigidum]|uniref:MAP7 domain-containing protein 1 n=1 Tax=Lolium rigidum TaxID=89674 RepID=UPI001F5C2566|nr:MAP7 domain-containing protein 1 [Lolium rigidum]
MAADEADAPPPPTKPAPAPSPAPPTPSLPPQDPAESPLAAYLGLAFALFLATLPAAGGPRHVASLQSRGRLLAARLLAAEDQLRQLRARRREDARANARAAEILAARRASWSDSLARAADEAAALRARLADAEQLAAAQRARADRLEREALERDSLLSALLAATRAGDAHAHFRGGREQEEDADAREHSSDPAEPYGDTDAEALAAAAALYAQQRQQQDGFAGDDFYASAAAAASGMPPWMDARSKGWQDMKYEPVESMYNTKHSVPRRESPWKVDVESSGVPGKLRLLEQELINLEKVGNGDLSKIPLVMRKQVKRYQTLAGKIDDLCKRMQASDPCDSTLNSEFRTQRQTEYLLEAFHLQHRATETRQKLSALQAETAKSSFGDELTAEAKMSTRRALSSVRNNFKEIQRSLEIWLARILGDLEGMLARDGASRIREYILSPYASAVR